MNERMNLPCHTLSFFTSSHVFPRCALLYHLCEFAFYTASGMHRGRKQLGDNLRVHIEKNVIRQNDRNFDLRLHIDDSRFRKSALL